MSKDLNLARISENLTPKERVLLVVHNDVEEQKTGKAVLSDAEKHSLTEGWTPKTNFEVNQYNLYIRGWRTTGFAEIDAQTAFLNAQLTYFQEKQISNFLLIYPAFRELKRWVERLDDIKLVKIDQALEIIKKQREVKLEGGLDYSRAVYQLAFESLSKELQEDLLILFPDAKYETDYLDEEEAIANLFDGKEKLTTEENNKLAGLIVKKSYNQYAKEYQFWHYFASIPIKEIAKKWVNKRKIKLETLPEDERFKKAFDAVSKDKKLTTEEALLDYTAENITGAINDYAAKHQTTVDAELKAVCLEWLDNGLLNEHVPLFKSTDTVTCNGVTKLSSDVIYKEWIKTKTKAKITLDSLISAGKLSKKGNIVTGDSLYSFKGNYQFTKEHNEYVDRYDPNLGILYADDDPEQKGVHLDRELLITNLDEDGKPLALNFSQISIARIKSYIELMEFVKETEVNGERVIEFEDNSSNELIKNTTEELKKYYSTLLTFRDLFEKLSKVYEVDLTVKIDKWVEGIEKFIDSHNFILKQASRKDFEEMRTKKVVRFKDNLFIEKSEIQKDDKFASDYFKEFEEILNETC
jgi:hypothetical protein